MRLAHLSDIHFGRITHPGVVDAIVREINAKDFNLVVVSGDLTQRARRHEYREARAMLDSFDAPVLVVPGNHDVRAWWHNPFERVWRSTLRFQRFITKDLRPSVTQPGLAVFGLNSAHGVTIKGGRIRSADVHAMESFFASQPAGAFRVLVLHHHLTRLAKLGNHDVSIGAKHALHAAQRSGVDLVLCGHLHRSHVDRIEVVRPGRADADRLVIASAGTATSSRGRGDDKASNVYNWITIDQGGFVVQERQFVPHEGVFEVLRESEFARV